MNKMREKIISKFSLTDEYVGTLMTLAKQRLGILSNIKDLSIEARILASIQAVIGTRKIKIDMENAEQLMLLVDMAAWNYSNLNDSGAMPIDLRYRLNNVFLHGKGVENDI